MGPRIIVPTYLSFVLHYVGNADYMAGLFCVFVSVNMFVKYGLTHKANR